LPRDLTSECGRAGDVETTPEQNLTKIVGVAGEGPQAALDKLALHYVKYKYKID